MQDTPRDTSSAMVESMAWRRIAPGAILLASFAALAVAYGAQYLDDLEPCVLCLYQRVPYAIAGALGLAGFAVSGARFRRLAVGACAPVFLAGAAIAFYHVGVEQHWWQSAAGCGGQLPGAMTGAELAESLAAPPEKACDEVDWTFLGVSMATWNVAASLGLAAFAAWAWRRMA